MAVIDKDQALAALERHRAEVLTDGSGCMLCALARGRAVPEPLVETRAAQVLLDRFACRPGHLMVVTKAHVERTTDLSWETYAEVQRLVFDANHALEQAFAPGRIFTATLGASTELPMSYAHHHVHVIPVPETDERARPAQVLTWSNGVVVYGDDEARVLRARILEHWPVR